MRRKRRKPYVDLCEEALHQEQWEDVGDGCRYAMDLFDRAPPYMREVLKEVGVNAAHAMDWYREFCRTNPPAVADRLAAKYVKKLVRQQHELQMKQAADELHDAGKALSVRLRR